jgi:hypothetical protein
MMEAASISENSVNVYQTTRRYNPEGRQDLKSHSPTDSSQSTDYITSAIDKVLLNNIYRSILRDDMGKYFTCDLFNTTVSSIDTNQRRMESHSEYAVSSKLISVCLYTS